MSTPDQVGREIVAGLKDISVSLTRIALGGTCACPTVAQALECLVARFEPRARTRAHVGKQDAERSDLPDKGETGSS